MSKLRAGEKSGEKEGAGTSLRLTPKQDNFCLAYLETGNASEAYRRSYNTNKMKPETINIKASELLNHGKITVRLSELKKPVIEKAQMTFAGHLEDLKALRDAAASVEQFSAAITAEVSRGRASGYYSNTQAGTEEVEIEISKRTVNEKD